MSTTHPEPKQVYRIQGLTCANCAMKFENNVKHLAGVTNATVNFGASKITVYGETTLEALQKAGSFDNLKVYPEKAKIELQREPLVKAYWNVLLSGLFLIVGYALPEQSIASVLVFAASILFGGYSLFMKGSKNLFRLQFDMNTLMTVAVIGASILGEWSEGATVVILFAISEALERHAMEKARQSIRTLIDAAPKVALVRRNQHEVTLDVDEIMVGDIMIVKPGQKLAMDGIIVKGTSTINQAPITGESVPVSKTMHDEVFAGTLNEEGLLEVKVTKRADDTTIAKIIHLVEEAQAQRAPAQAFIDSFAKSYTPAIMVVAIAVALVPPLFLSGSWSEWVYRGLAVLVVGCPCALVISTPIAIVTAIGKAARCGVLIKGGIYLEEAGRVNAIAFDKTGTLTKGFPEVTELIAFLHDETELLRIAALLEKGSQHPLASAIVRRAASSGIDLSAPAEDFQSVTGKGIRAKIDGKTYYMGSPAYLAEINSDMLTPAISIRIRALQQEGKTVMALGTESDILGLIAVADDIRDSSKTALHQLKQHGIKQTMMLTGDNQATAKAIGNRLGITEIRAELLPQTKLHLIKQLKDEYSSVAMVGDGVNDAPALAAASVGIAMGGAGTDTAMETADIVLMGDDLRKLPFTIKLSRKALAIIKQNIAFSIGIKLLALMLIVPGWLTLWLAISADMGATLIVTANSLRLLKVNE
ncbi:heavy metal translocating P-type ATPase [Brevibacillus migulae]|uniref:heavy metal translocating P-type ATPase n=1 Tax=Brevibacillus migulae TaxID=1644114 RepID=UPI00106E5293|nr:heavy metal translocating P-type ATPase [Brevibacillus migulae]